jgi:ATP-dependent Clp protease ATP-binding subunit ClpA
LAARWIGIPYVNIDAASMSDPHTAASQLLGAGRGIVSSYRAGRLEQIARHHTGAVVEISDLDHAPGPVRLALAEMFLQVLDNGEIQSSSGDIIPCANALFVFTVNLPAGEDERVRNTIGFARSVSRSDIAERVSAALKAFTSSAFLSRIGTPIVFDPLDATAMAEIEEGAVRAAVVAAAERLRIHCLEVVLEDRLGARMVAMLGSETTAVGARAAIEHARAMTATAVAKLAKRGWNGEAQALFVSFGDDGELVMTPRE